MEIILASGLLSLIITYAVMGKTRKDIIKYVDEMDELTRETMESTKEIVINVLDDFVKKYKGE